MSIITNLQKHIIDKKYSTTDLLREALLIASKLELEEFENWINNELKGYSNTEVVPEYRIIQSELNFFNPYVGYIPAIANNNIINKLKYSQSIGELEELIKSSNSKLKVLIHDSQKYALMKRFKTDFEPFIFVDKTQIFGIIEQVRNTILGWTITLEKEGIIGDDTMSFSDEEKNKAQKTIHIENFNGVMGDIENIGNVSTGNNNQNISNINTNLINNKINEIVDLVNKLPISDKKEIIEKIKKNKDNKKELTKVLGNILTRGSEIATIIPAIGELLGLLS